MTKATELTDAEAKQLRDLQAKQAKAEHAKAEERRKDRVTDLQPLADALAKVDAKAIAALAEKAKDLAVGDASTMASIVFNCMGYTVPALLKQVEELKEPVPEPVVGEA